MTAHPRSANPRPTARDAEYEGWRSEDASGAEHSHRWAVDLGHERKALAELGSDPLDRSIRVGVLRRLRSSTVVEAGIERDVAQASRPRHRRHSAAWSPSGRGLAGNPVALAETAWATRPPRTFPWR